MVLFCKRFESHVLTVANSWKKLGHEYCCHAYRSFCSLGQKLHWWQLWRVCLICKAAFCWFERLCSILNLLNSPTDPWYCRSSWRYCEEAGTLLILVLLLRMAPGICSWFILNILQLHSWVSWVFSKPLRKSISSLCVSTLVFIGKFSVLFFIFMAV